MQSLDVSKKREISPVLLTYKRNSHSRMSAVRATHRTMNKSVSPVNSGCSEGRDELGSLQLKSFETSQKKNRQSRSKKINIEIHIQKPMPNSAGTSDLPIKGNMANTLQSQLFQAAIPRQSVQNITNHNVRYENQKSLISGSQQFLIKGSRVGILDSPTKTERKTDLVSQSQAKLMNKPTKNKLSVS